MATHRPITPSSISPPTHGQSPSNLFYSLLNIRRTIRCVGSFSATPDCTSAANDRHGHANSRIHQLRTSLNSRWSHFTSNSHETASARFRIVRGSISYVLVDKRWVLFTQAYIWSLKNTGSGSKPTFKMYLIQLVTYVTYYLLAFGAILKYLFWSESSDLTRVTDAQSPTKNVEHNIMY
jgi:hypothetical protein